MKKIYSLFMVAIFAAFFTTNAFAQRTCAAHDHMIKQHEQSPKMKEKAAELEQYTQQFLKSYSSFKATETRTIPVNVIVVYANSQQNISQAQIESQITVLNKDYGGTNPDLSNVPSEFTSVTSTGTGIQFVLSNIERHSNSRSSWGTNDDVKYAYPPTSPSTTLNMWICNIGGGILGYAQFPGGAAATDGVVFSPQYCGSSDYDDGSFYLSAPFDKGRTCTHEVGHYLNLRHIWGDGGCSVDDYVSDTPLAGAANYSCPSYPSKSCSSNGGWNSDMFMNYMDYVDDQCMYMFSEGQEARMWACLNSTRSDLGSSGGNIAPTADANGPYSGDPGVGISFSSAGSNDPDGSIVSYNWNFGDGTTSTSANPSHTYSAAGNYNVSLTVTDNEGATGTDNTTATVGSFCSGVSACDGAITLTLVTDRYGSETSWTLKNSAGTTIESGSGYSNNRTYNFNWNLPEGEYTFTINDSYGDGICCSYGNGSYTLKDGCGNTLVTGGNFGRTESTVICTGTTQNVPPTAEANGPYTGYAGNSISFSSAGSTDSDGTIASYLWNFGDGTTSTSANPSHTYSAAGNYNATLTVTDNDGATGTDQATVNVTTPPTCVDVTLTIKLDNYPEETSWTIKNSAGTTVASGGTYGSQPDGSTVTFTDCLETGCYTFTINDSYGDGICCRYGVGNYSLKDASGTVLASGGEFGRSEATNFCLGSGRNTPGTVNTQLSHEGIKLFPNPVGDHLNVRLFEGKVISAKILSLNGQEIMEVKVNEDKIDLSDLKPGTYIISIDAGKKLINEKISKE
jgi:PKD repeat protein